MKKFVYTLGLAAVLCLASCGGGSVDSKIERINEISVEMQKNAAKQLSGEGDPAKIQEEQEKLMKEAEKISNELEKEDLTDEQKAKLVQAAFGAL